MNYNLVNINGHNFDAMVTRSGSSSTSTKTTKCSVNICEVSLIRLLEELTGKRVLMIEAPRRQHCAFEAPNISAEVAYVKHTLPFGETT